MEPAGVVDHPPGELLDPLAQLDGGLPAEAPQEIPGDGVPGGVLVPRMLSAYLRSWPGRELWKSTRV